MFNDGAVRDRGRQAVSRLDFLDFLQYFVTVCLPDSLLYDIGGILGGHLKVIFVKMIEVTCNDRLGKKVRVKCNPDDTVGDLKKLIAAQTGTKWERIVLKKWYTIFKDHITLEDYEIHDGMNLELYYQ